MCALSVAPHGRTLNDFAPSRVAGKRAIPRCRGVPTVRIVFAVDVIG